MKEIKKVRGIVFMDNGNYVDGVDNNVMYVMVSIERYVYIFRILDKDTAI